MTQVWIYQLLFLFLGITKTAISAQEGNIPIVFFGRNLQDGSLDFSASVEYSVDTTGKRDLEYMRDARFSPLSAAPKWGEIILQNCQHNYWLRFRATGRPDALGEQSEAYLFFGAQHFVTLFFSKNGLDWQQREGGMAHHRTVGKNEYLLLETAANDTTLFYARIANRPRANFMLRPQLVSQQSFDIREALALHKNKWNIYFSLAVMSVWIFIVLFSLLQYGQNHERSYLYYALYVLSLAIGLLKTQEYQWQMPVLFCYFPSTFVYSEGIVAALPHITYRLFVADITDLKKHLPWVARLFKWTIWFLLGYIVVDTLLETFFFREAYSIPVYLAVRVLLGFVSVYCIVRMFSIRTPIARMVMWGTVVLYAGVGIGLFITLNTSFSFQAEKVFYIMVACTIEILIFLTALGRRSKLVSEERSRLEKDLLEAHTRIARDLHDDLGSTLSSISLNSQLAANANPDKMREALIHSGEIAREMTSKVRDLMWSLQPDSDTMESILSRMRQFSAPLLESQNIDYRFLIDEKTLAVPLSIASRRNFYLFFKEAVNNLAKYANATTVIIRVYCSPDGKMLTLEVADNGKGFDANTVPPGHGLDNMSARASHLKGQMSLDTAHGQGTKIMLTFPI